jgi:hypothetical protein
MAILACHWQTVPEKRRRSAPTCMHLGADPSQATSMDLWKYIKDQKQEFFKVSIHHLLL